MQKVFVAQNHAEAHLVRGLLEAEGIEAEIRGEALSTLQGGLAVLELRPSVWVRGEARIAQAHERVAQFLKGEIATGEAAQAWACAQCGERHEAQFTDCWQCGTARPESSPA